MPHLLCKTPKILESRVQKHSVAPNHPPPTVTGLRAYCAALRSGAPAPHVTRSFRPAQRSGQHDVVVVEGLQQLHMQDKLDDTGCPQTPRLAGRPRRRS